MLFEQTIICDNIYIGDNYADPCKIIVVGNRGICNIPHFDLVGDDLYCNIGLLEPIYIFEGSKSKNTLQNNEIENLISVLNQKNHCFTNYTNWQCACYIWNSLNFDYNKIDKDFIINIQNIPNYNKMKESVH